MIVLGPHGLEFSDAWVDGDDTLRFAAVYAAGEIVTTYDEEVQPDGSRERRTVH